MHPCGESAGGASRHQLGWPKAPRRLGWRAETGLVFGLGRATSDRRSRQCPRRCGVLSSRRTEFESPCLFNKPDAVHRRVWRAGVFRICLACRRPQYGHQAVDEHPHPLRGVVARELFVTAPGDHAAPGGQNRRPVRPRNTLAGWSASRAASYRRRRVHRRSRRRRRSKSARHRAPPADTADASNYLAVQKLFDLNGIENSERRRHSFRRSPTRIALLRTCPNMRAEPLGKQRQPPQRLAGLE